METQNEQTELTPINQKPFAEAAVEFLKRVDLKGAEVGPFTEIWNLLNAIGTGELMLVPKDKLEELVKAAQPSPKPPRKKPGPKKGTTKKPAETPLAKPPFPG